MDIDQQFEEFAKRWPDLIQKSKQDYIGVDVGWYTILDVLFGTLSRDVEQARYQLKYALENPDKKFIKTIPEYEADLAKALEELPTIVQIKEKFGGLRIYTDGATEIQQAYINFSASMASRTCEVCGSPGELRNTGWMKTLCHRHDRENNEDQKL